MKKIFDYRYCVKKGKSLIVGISILLFPPGLFAGNAMDTSTSIDIFAANQLLSKTINIGFTMDAPKEGAWGHTLNTSEFTTN